MANLMRSIQRVKKHSAARTAARELLANHLSSDDFAIDDDAKVDLAAEGAWVTVRVWVATCVHLADSDVPSPNLSPEPCPSCGRYFTDDV